MVERVVQPNLDDVNEMLRQNPMAQLQVKVISLSRELQAAYDRIEELEKALAESK